MCCVEKWLLPCGCSHIFIIEILLNNYLGSKNSKWILKMKQISPSVCPKSVHKLDI